QPSVPGTTPFSEARSQRGADEAATFLALPRADGKTYTEPGAGLVSVTDARSSRRWGRPLGVLEPRIGGDIWPLPPPITQAHPAPILAWSPRRRRADADPALPSARGRPRRPRRARMAPLHLDVGELPHGEAAPGAAPLQAPRRGLGLARLRGDGVAARQADGGGVAALAEGALAALPV
ncbi:unnamed protein product, partial [Prorocentrum cordatum]